MLTLEAIHEVRIIPLAARPHLPESIRLWSGDSRGRWTARLVVETTNFAPYVNFLGSAESLQLVERFTRTAADEHRLRADHPEQSTHHLDETVDGRDSPEAEQGQTFRIWCVTKAITM